MERIRWWWNLVYYFHVKWYAGLGKIVCFPIICFFRSRLFENYWKKKEVADVNKYMKEGLKQAQISETYIRLYLSVFLLLPLFAVVFVTDVFLCERTSFEDFQTFLVIGIFSTATIVFCPVQNYLLGKNDEYKKYFKEFDKLFENDMRKKCLYGFLSFLTLVALFSTIVFGFVVADYIKNG